MPVTAFSVWAPAAGRVDVEVAGQRYPMSLRTPAAGWWERGRARRDAPAPTTGSGWTAASRCPTRARRASRSACKGPSRSLRPFRLPLDRPRLAGRRRCTASVIYEMHVGTFTAEGTFDAAIGRLDHLRDLGVHTVELMPVAAFPGRHGWGYDGINLWAVHEPYGGPDGLKRFVDACHARGLAVLLDVVYNHVGIGNRLATFGPYFTDAHVTPWGPAVNLDQPGSDEVRAFLIGNALMWLRDYHLDGLRLDAVHALEDHRALHFLEELAAEVQALAARLDRELILIAEIRHQRPPPGHLPGGGRLRAGRAVERRLPPRGARGDHRRAAGLLRRLRVAGGAGQDLHPGVLPRRHLVRVPRPQRTGGRSTCCACPAHRFLGYLQDHDQVGNRATGDRIAAHRCHRTLLKVGAGLVLTAPFTPMLFMGEEWGADTPWQYFTDHIEPWLAQAVAEVVEPNGRGDALGRGHAGTRMLTGTPSSELDWEQGHWHARTRGHAWVLVEML